MQVTHVLTQASDASSHLQIKHIDKYTDPSAGVETGFCLLNLLTHSWIPVTRRLSGPCIIAPCQVTEAVETDPVVAIDWPRADFRIATLEFLIGLLSTACPPQNARAWLDVWDAPPSPDALAEAFAPLVHAFALDGDGPRFLQDAEDLVSAAEPVERLLIESPGESTVGKNTDLLVRRGRVASLGRPAAAMALYTFQSWAPSGGAGNRTGLRGGGPLVTLVLPERTPLWHLLWANVLAGQAPEPDEYPLVFPWLAPTVTSKGAHVVTPEDAHPLQCFWGMPRRIRLDFAAANPATRCDLTSRPDEVVVRSWHQRPHGANYAAWGGVHPLTPVYQLKAGTEKLPVHPQPGGIRYRHWLGLVLKEKITLREPAESIGLWHGERALDVKSPSRLLAAGFDMDNMKARGFVESEMPLPTAPDRERQTLLDTLATRLVRASDVVVNLLRGAVRNALFSAGATVKIDSELLSSLRERFWADTEAGFFDALRRAAGDAPAPDGAEENAWHDTLRRTALRLFDEAAPLDPDCVPMVRAGETVPRLIRARRALVFALQGYGADGTALFTALGLAAPEPTRKGKKK